MIYEKIISEKLDELAILELKEGASVKVGEKEYFGYLPLPILNSKLITLVKDEIEDIPVEYFVEGMVYFLSLNDKSKYTEKYLDFIKTMTGDIKGYLFKRALENINNEDFVAGVIFLNLLVKEDLADEKILFTLGQAMENLEISLLNQKEKNEYALEIMNLYERVLNLDPSFALAHYKLGYMYKEFGQFVKAKLSFEKFLKLDKNEFRLQEVRERIDEINSEIKKEEAVMDINQGNYEEALKKLLEVNLEKRDDLYFYHLSLCYYNLDDIEASLSAINKAIEIEDISIYHNQLAIIYQKLGDIKAAKKEIEETIDRFGPDYYLNFNLATIQYNEGDIEAAIGNFEIAYEIEANPELADIIDQLSKSINN